MFLIIWTLTAIITFGTFPFSANAWENRENINQIQQIKKNVSEFNAVNVIVNNCAVL